MPYVSDFTGLKWPEGKDFESNTPQIWVETDRLLGQGGMVVSAIDVDDRNRKFPAPGLNQRPVVQLGNGELHKWDGRQWLIHDDKPKSATFYMYSMAAAAGGGLLGMTMDPDGSGDGGGQVWWKRDGHFVDWRISVVRGADANVGSGTYTWLTPFSVRWGSIGGVPVQPTGGLSGMVVRGGMSYPCGVYWIDKNHPILVRYDGTRVGYDTFSWGTGDSIVLGGRSRIGGLL